MIVKTDTRGKTPLLIVDDDKAVRRLLARVAERAGFDVDTAKDGLQALEMLERKQYDIAIVDLMMPRLSGYELVQKISTLTPRPTIIVATALMNGDFSSLDDSLVRRVIKKPFDINAVANALIETARDIAEQRATVPPLAGTKIIAKDATIVTEKATVLAEQATVVAGEVNIVPIEAKGADAGEPVAPVEEPPAEIPPPEKIE